MISLDANSTLRAIAGSAATVTMTVFGDEISNGADSFKKLYQGQVASSITTVYTVPGSTQALIRSVMLLNTSASPVTVALYTDGAVASNQIYSITLPANGEAIYSSAGWQVLDSSGSALTSAASGTVFPVGVGAFRAYTPTWTQGATITKSINDASYFQVGKLVVAKVVMTATGAGTASTAHKVTLPVTATGVSSFAVLGPADYLDSGTAAYTATAVFFDANTVQFRMPGQDGTGSSFLGVSAASPTGNTNVATAAGDILGFIATYEAA